MIGTQEDALVNLLHHFGNGAIIHSTNGLFLTGLTLSMMEVEGRREVLATNGAPIGKFVFSDEAKCFLLLLTLVVCHVVLLSSFTTGGAVYLVFVNLNAAIFTIPLLPDILRHYTPFVDVTLVYHTL